MGKKLSDAFRYVVRSRDVHPGYAHQGRDETGGREAVGEFS